MEQLKTAWENAYLEQAKAFYTIKSEIHHICQKQCL